MVKAQKWIDWTLESQTASGAFGPYADDPEHFDYWPLMPMLMTLEYYYDATGDERVIPFLTRYFAWQAEALKTTPLSSWGQARGGDNIFAVWWLYEKTGDASLQELCRLLYQQTDDWASAYDEDAWRKIYHIVNVQESFKLFPLMYAITGEQKWLDTYYRGIENIYIATGRADGMSNGDEVTRGTEVEDDMRYDQAHAPWILTAKASAVPNWVINQKTQTAGILPVSPVKPERLDGDTVTVRLIPYAFSRLRMTCIPWSGDGETVVTVDATQTAEDTLTFVNVIAPAELPEEIGTGKPEIIRSLHLSGTPGTYTLYINRAMCGSVEVDAAGNGRIDASALRYDSRNLVELRTTDGKALPHNAHMTLCVLSESYGSIRYEAEDARVTGGAAIRGDHVGGMDNIGSAVIFPAITFSQAGTYRIRVYYTAPQGEATHSLIIDNTRAGRLNYPANPLCTSWGTFDARVYADFEVDIPTGTHVLRLVRGTDDIGFAELDALSVCLKDAHPVDKIPGVQRETIAQVEAEHCKVSGGCYVSTRHVAGIDKTGDTVELTLTVPTDGTYTFRVFYTAPMGDVTHTLITDGNKVGHICYAGTTSGWGEFQPGNYAELTLTLSAGTHTVQITRTDADAGFAELDRFEVLH